MIVVEVDSPTRDDIVELIDTHLGFAREVTPPGFVFAMDASSLDDPSITLLSARSASGELLAIGALRELGDGTGEIKSMHTAAAHRGQGHGEVVLSELLALARSRSYHAVYLETGSQDAFESARRLYRRSGFVECGAFGSYDDADTSTFMMLALNS